MSETKTKKFMLHYYTMSVFVICAALAFKLSGYLSMGLAIAALLLANPAVRFPKERLRWLIIVLLLMAMVYFFPDLTLLKELQEA